MYWLKWWELQRTWEMSWTGNITTSKQKSNITQPCNFYTDDYKFTSYYYGHYFMYMWCSYSDLYACCLCLILYHVGSSLIHTCFLLMHSNIHVTTVCSRVIGVIIAWFPQLKTWKEPNSLSNPIGLVPFHLIKCPFGLTFVHVTLDPTCNNK